MTIEDVDFLKKNAIKQNYLFLVDSSDRNRLINPTPSEYIVNFDVPFKNVVGLEVVEANIPRTVYNIDTSNNVIKFLIHDNSIDTTLPSSLSNYVTRNLEPGDYTIQTLIPALNSILSMPVNNNPNNSNANIISLSLSNPPEVKSIIQFYCPYSFSFDMTGSTIAETLGFDTYADILENNVNINDRRYNAIHISTPTNNYIDNNGNIYTNNNDIYNINSGNPFDNNIKIINKTEIYNTNYKIYHSVDIIDKFLDISSIDIYTGPRSVIRTLPLIYNKSYVSQNFKVGADCTLTKISIAVSTMNKLISTNEVKYSIYNLDDLPTTLTNLNLNVNSLQSGIIPIDYTDGSYSTIIINNSSLILNPYKEYCIVFTGGENDPIDNNTTIYYNDISVNIQNNKLQIFNNNTLTWTTVDTANGIHYESSIILTTQYLYHKLIAPGLVTLNGDRYIVLRCKEIEASMNRSLSYTKHCLGLAKFKLGTLGYSQNDLSYSKIPFREFHPIGKLPRMTLRFERSNGSLYDFKGVNHTITFSIYYYEVIQKNNFIQSILNPNYNADHIAYLYKQEEQEEDSDDQEYDYNRDHPEATFKINESNHLSENIRNRDNDILYNINMQNIRIKDYDDDTEEDSDEEEDE